MGERLPVVVTAAVVLRDGCVLAARRKTGSRPELLWEFPGGKLESGESPEESLTREIREELGVEIHVGPILDVVFHRYPEGSVLLLFYACNLASGEPQPLDVEELAWLSRDEISNLDWAPADEPFARRLAEEDGILSVQPRSTRGKPG